MQILQWFPKLPLESPRVASSDQKVKSKDIVVLNNDGGIRLRRLKRVERSKLHCEDLNFFHFIFRNDVSKAWFYHTLNLKRIGSVCRKQNTVHSMKMEKEGSARGLGITQKADSAHVGNKVLPITDTAQSSSANNSHQCSNGEKKEKMKGDKTKTISRMKELLKWAVAVKTERGGKYIGRKVLHFRNRSAPLKAVPDDDQLSNESPKISIRWDLESCSTTSSVYSAISAVNYSLKHEQIVNADSVNSTPLHARDQFLARSGNWITTDTEFVVLEL